MDIQKLIDKFMDGTSTLEEERRLEEYFLKERDIPEKLEPYREMFAYFDRGMTNDVLLTEGNGKTDDRQHTHEIPVEIKANGHRMVFIRRILAVAASVAVLLVIAYSIKGGGEKDGCTTGSGSHAIAQTVAADSLKATADTIKENVGGEQDYNKRERHIPRKYRYKPAPPENMIADGSTTNVDSIDNAARRMTDAELRKVEFEQRYMQSLIQAVTLLNAADIAAVGDDEEL